MTAIEQQPEIDCVLCGKHTGTMYATYGERMRRDKHCFTCVYWQEQIAADAADPERAVIVNGVHHTLGDEPTEAQLRDRLKRSTLGWGGAKVRVRFHDGREVVSHNVWYQGEIPERWRDQLPDNAVFVTA